jgi:hypothetical protein
VTKKIQPAKETTKAPLPIVPQWAVQPYLYQQLLLEWFETIHEGLKEIHTVLEGIASKMDEKD